MSTDAALAASAKAASLASGLASMRPHCMGANGLVWLITPGAEITVARYAIPPTT
jgi:hypothetical protein